MNKKIWDLYAPIYKRAMKADQKIYDFMYERIPETVKGKEVLEIATGPGLLAKHIASAAKSMLATDYSDGMIAEAKKGEYPANLRFEVADAMALPYEDNSFDVVLIANAADGLFINRILRCDITDVIIGSGLYSEQEVLLFRAKRGTGSTSPKR